MTWDRAAVQAPGALAPALPRPRSTRRQHPVAHAALALQRQIGNQAVRRLLRAPPRRSISANGTGYDGLRQPYGDVITRDFSKAQLEELEDFRQWLEDTYSDATGYNKTIWAREAGSRAAAFTEQSALARAQLYAEFQRMMIQADGGGASSWVAMVERGTDGSYIFKGNPRPPGGGEQRIFVVREDGSCHVGTRSALSGSGNAKTPDYSKLTRIGPKTPSGGGGPDGSGPASDPATVPPTEEGEGGTGGTAEEEGAVVGEGEAATELGVLEGAGMVVGSLLEGLVIAVAIAGGINVAQHMLSGKGNGDPRYNEAQRKLMKAMEPKVVPAVRKALEDKAKDARQMALSHPDFTIYANVSMDLELRTEKRGTQDPVTYLVDLRFVRVELGVNAVTKDEVLSSKRTNANTVTKTVRRMTYPIELNPLNESFEVHKWRALRAQAQKAIAHKMSARAVAEGSHWVSDTKPDGVGRVWTYLDERKEKERKKFGLPSWREEVELVERSYFVEAYIDYASEDPSHKSYYDAAVQYYDELKRQIAEHESRDGGTPTTQRGTLIPLTRR